jgi:hypothetical protein
MTFGVAEATRPQPVFNFSGRLGPHSSEDEQTSQQYRQAARPSAARLWYTGDFLGKTGA